MGERATPEDKVRALARRCAAAGLTLRDGRALLDALWVADQRIGHGSDMAAARAHGMSNVTLWKLRRACEVPE